MVTDKDRELAQKIIMRLAFMSGNIDLSGRDKRDNIAKELAAHRESQWQDISTAPTHKGGCVDLYSPELGVFEGYLGWSLEHKKYLWHVRATGECLHADFELPTHWRPRPTPPKESK